MKYYYTLALIVITLNTVGQKNLDTRIYVKVNDTANLRERIKLALINADFPIKENKRDTIYTFPQTMKATQMVAFAYPKDNLVELWGLIGDVGVNFLGYSTVAGKKGFRKVYYYKKDKYWNKLLQVAKEIGGEISFGK